MSDEVAVRLVEQAKRVTDDLQARLFLAAAVERIAARIGLRSIVSGGTAVDYYVGGATGTSGSYPAKWRASGDIDLVVVSVDEGYAAADRLALALEKEVGFEPMRAGRDADGREVLLRGLHVPGFGYGVEIVATELIGDPMHVWTVEVDGHEVHLRGPEDCLLQYAESGWDTHASHEWTRALAIASAMRDDLDLAYLRRKAEERRMPQVLEHALSTRALPEKRRPLS